MDLLLDSPLYLSVIGWLAVAGLLLWQFVRTRNWGYLIILAGLLVWPLAAKVARGPLVDYIAQTRGIGGLSTGRSVLTVDSTVVVVKTALLFVGFVMIARFRRVPQRSYIDQTES
ncbi:MAG: hypothetical protein GF355_15000 [Candidatus Eisenbacteria bacterium]|nr:hypothetical protein [Candidatus Eisenbacteria bacterium]